MDGTIKFVGEYLDDIEVIGTKYNSMGEIIHKYNNFNGKGKEYNDNGKLEFEGEYLNGKRNGKGKEYIGDVLIFEGEHLNGKKWKGKGYDNLNNIVYELNDGKGYIKEYWYNGRLR